MSLAEKNQAGKTAKMPDSIDVMGASVVPFSSYDHALECIEGIVESKRKSFWVAINPQKCYRLWHDKKLKKIIDTADVGICDGVGVSIASQILHGQKIERCTGCDLFFRSASMAAKKDWGVFLLGASPESNAGARAKLMQMYPDLRIVGSQDGYFKDDLEVIEQINASKADMLFVAMGTPTQEYWISKYRDAIDASFCMGVGGSFDVASGTINRAPKFFQKTGTEFLFQLITEPRKRWPRQKVYFPFMLKVIGKKLFGSTVPAKGTKV